MATTPDTFRQVDLAPSSAEIVALSTSALLLWLVHSFAGYTFVNFTGPLVLLLVLGAANWQLARVTPGAVWTPLFAFRLSAAVFLGFGNILIFFVSEEALDYISSLYAFTNQEASKINLLFLASTALLLTGAKIASKLGPPDRTKHVAGAGFAISGTDAALPLGLLFYALGFAYQIAIDVPIALGWFAFTVPNAVSLPFQAASSIGVFLICDWALRRKGAAYLAIPGAIVPILLVALILFNKTVALLPILMFGLAVMFRGVSIARLLGVTALLAVTLGVLQPAVADARLAHAALYGDVSGGTVGERLGHYVRYAGGDRMQQDEPGSGATRLSYLNAASFIVARYDEGLPSSSFENGAIALIPRLVWPDKPFVTNEGSELHYLITGRDTSFLAPTTPGDVYWNAGWTGVFIIFPLLGALAFFASRTCLRIVEQGDWLLMPFVLIAFRIGVSSDQAFIIGVLVPCVAAGLLLGALQFAKRLLARRTVPPVAPDMAVRLR